MRLRNTDTGVVINVADDDTVMGPGWEPADTPAPTPAPEPVDEPEPEPAAKASRRSR